MKANKLFMLALAAGAMVLSSCSSEDITGENNIQKEGTPVSVFTAGMETSSSTRTHLNNSAVWWNHDDAISIFDTTNHKYVWSAAVADKDSTNCTFRNDDSAVTNGGTHLALYPYQSGAGVSNGTITGVVLPSKQTAVAGSYDKSAALMVATSTDTNLSFKNLNTLIAVTPTVDCTDIIISAGNELAGEVIATPASDGATYEPVSGKTSNVVTLSGNIQAGNTYYISVLPGSKTNLTFTLVRVESNDDGDLCYQRTAGNSQTLNRSAIYNLGEIGSTTGDYNVSNATVNAKNLGIHLPEATGHPMVNLGLKDASGNYTCWAKYNVGYTAAKPYGDFFAWGDIEPLYDSYKIDFTTGTSNSGTTVTPTWKSGMDTKGYSWDNYSYSNGTTETGTQPYENGVLKAANDAATANLGTGWATPTMAQITTLRTECVWVYGTETHGNYTIAGFKVYRAKNAADKGKIYFTQNNKWYLLGSSANSYNQSTTDASVSQYMTETTPVESYTSGTHMFLPASGYFNGSTFCNGAWNGSYWSSTWGSATNARYLRFSDYYVGPQGDNYRYNGRTVRGVCQ